MGKRIEQMGEGKKNIITALLHEYDIQTAEYIQNALKDLLDGTIKSMVGSEMHEYLGYEPYGCTDSTNVRSGKKSKTI